MPQLIKSTWPLLILLGLCPVLVNCGNVREYVLQSAMPKKKLDIRSDLQLGISEPTARLEPGSVIPVLNNFSENIAQFELKEFKIDITKVKLFSTSFPFDETIATNIALDLDNSSRELFPSKIARPFDGYTTLSISNLKFSLVGSLQIPNEDSVRVSYIVKFTDETYLKSLESGNELTIDLSGSNTLRINYDPLKWFDFNTEVSDEIILDQLKNLDFDSINGAILKDEFLANFRNSMTYSLN